MTRKDYLLIADAAACGMLEAYVNMLENPSMDPDTVASVTAVMLSGMALRLKRDNDNFDMQMFIDEVTKRASEKDAQ